MASIIEATKNGASPARCAVSQIAPGTFAGAQGTGNHWQKSHLGKKEDPVWQFKKHAVERWFER